MIDDERTELRRSDPPAEEATRVVDRSLEETRLRAGTPDRRRPGRPAAAPAPGGDSTRTARVPGTTAEHAAYTVRRETLTAPVTRSAASAAPSRPDAARAAAPARRRRPGALVLVLSAAALLVLIAAAVVILVLLVTAS